MPALLLLLVPGHWDAVPEGMAELRRHLSDEYGALLEVRPAQLDIPIPLCCGWGDTPAPGPDVGERIDAAFYSLDWVEESV